MNPGAENLPTRPGPVPAFLGAIAEPFYRAAITARNRHFDSAISGDGRIGRLPLPVVSVGNLSVGGTGKTPFVRWMARLLASSAAGTHRPLIALRGYKQAATGGVSDEAEEYRTLLPGIAIATGADRFATINTALANPPAGGMAPTVVVLDDGFQHRKLARDFDLVLIDATRPPMSDALLPAGWLREPITSLTRAHAVVVTHAEAALPGVVEAVLSAARAVNPSLFLAVTSHALTLPEAALGQRVLVVCGIGNPGPFIQAVRHLAQVVGSIELEDHAAYTPARVRQIARRVAATGTQLIVTTGKDAVKLTRLVPGALPVPVVPAGLALRFEQGESDLAAAIIAAVGRCA